MVIKTSLVKSLYESGSDGVSRLRHPQQESDRSLLETGSGPPSLPGHP